MSLTCVSGFWLTKNKHNNNYLDWFKNTLSINCPYVFFGNKESLDIVKQFRKDLETFYIECEIHEFVTYKYKDKLKTDEIHCPSIELNLIWHEKVFLLKKATLINPFNSKWFQWIDAGIFIYRNVKPPERKFPNIDILNSLPENKFIFSSSIDTIDINLVSKFNYYHYIAATSFILHINFIPIFSKIYDSYLEKNLDKNLLLTEQVIYTLIFKDIPSLFFQISNGYGSVTIFLYG